MLCWICYASTCLRRTRHVSINIRGVFCNTAVLRSVVGVLCSILGVFCHAAVLRSVVGVLCSVLDVLCSTMLCIIWLARSATSIRDIVGFFACLTHFRYLTFLMLLGFRQVGMSQAFTGHLLVENAFTLVHHEESFVTMHYDVRVGLDCRPPRLEEEAGFA